MSAPGTSRAERQAATDAANAAAAAAAAKSEAMPGGGINQPQYRAGGGPTWADTPAGRALRAEYEKSGVVFDSGGNIIYNPADLGAAQVERARAAQGLPPLDKTLGTVSPQYAVKVYSESRKSQQVVRSGIEKLNAIRAQTIQDIKSVQTQIKNMQEIRQTNWGNIQSERGYQNEISSLQNKIAFYNQQLSSIDAARQRAAQEQRAAQTYQTKAAFEVTRKKATEGPRPIQNALAADYTQRREAARIKPQKQRAQAQTGIKEKMFASPTFVQDASSFVRQPSFQGDTRKERPKAQQGITDKLFLNPNYVTDDQQEKEKSQEKTVIEKPRTITNYTLSLTENLQVGEDGFVEATPKQSIRKTNTILPNIPEGYTLAGSLENLVLIPERKTISQDRFGNISETSQVKPIEPTERKPDLLESTLKNLKGIKTGNILIDEAAKPFSLEVIGGAAGLVNLERMGAKAIKPEEPQQFTDIPQLTASSEYASGLFEGGKRAIEERNVKYFISGAGEAGRKAYELAKEQGPLATAAGVAGFLFPVGVGAIRKGFGFVSSTIRKTPTKLSEVLVKTPTPRIFYRGTNMMREQIPADVFQRDTATSFAKEQVRLGPTTATGVVTRSKSPVIQYDVTPTKELSKFDQGVKVKPVEEDPFYTPRPEMKRYRQVDYAETFRKDTAGAGFVEQRVDLGAGTTQTIEPKAPFTSKEIGLGKAESGIKLQNINLGTGIGQPSKGLPSRTFQSTYRQPVKEESGFVPERPSADIFQRDVFSETSVSLGRGTAKTPEPKFDQGVKVKPVEEDPFYTPRPEMKRYRQVDYAETFRKDTKLASFTEQGVSLGRGIVKRLGGKDKQSSTKKKPTTPTDTEQTGKSGATILLEKPKEAKFKSTQIELGKGKATVIATGGTVTAVPAPLISQALADEIPPAGITNSTGGNQTDTPPIPDEDMELDLTPAAFEPTSMTSQRPEFGAVVGQRGFAGVDTGLSSRARQRLSRVAATRTATRPALRSSVTTIPLFRQSQPQKQPQREKQAQKLKTPFPNPMRQPQRLVQPEAFKQKELLKLKTPPPPKKPRMIFALPPKRRRERSEKRKLKELKPNDFLGNASQENISSNYSRQEIILGIKRTAKIERKDLSKERKGMPRFVNADTSSLLTKSKPNLIRAEKKRSPLSL